MLKRRKGMAVLVAGAVAVMSGAAQADIFPLAGLQGPSSSNTPYLIGQNGALFASLLTVGDSVNLKPSGAPYQMVGIPDGLGAFSGRVDGNGNLSEADKYFTVLMNHELANNVGVARAHGAVGAFVSQWTIEKSTLKVVEGRDLINNVVLTTGGALSFNRFCSADLPALTAFYNVGTGLGTTNRIFMNGEEVSGGRAFGTVATGPAAGTAYELNKLGNFAWENSIANPTAQNSTIVMGMDDGALGASKVYLYQGTKTNVGTDVDKAGLTNGNLYTVKVLNGGASETRADDGTAGIGLVNGVGKFTLTAPAGATGFNRVEDGAWDPGDPTKFYFVTTDRMDAAKDGNPTDIPAGQVGRSRLWRLSFNDIADPAAAAASGAEAGTIELLLDGTEAHQMLDNMTVERIDGRVVVKLQEDPGNQAHLAKIWEYDVAGDTLILKGAHDSARFGDLPLGVATAPFAKDEESSGIVDVTALFEGVDGYDTKNYRYLLADVQAHRTGAPFNTTELVEGGQLLLMAQPVPEPSTWATLGLGLGVLGFVASRRRRSH